MDEIADRLPAGFHDAELHSVTIDYANSSAKFEVVLWVPSEQQAEAYASATVIIEGMQYFIIEPPLPNNYMSNGKQYRSTIDGYPTSKYPPESEDFPVIQDGKFAYTLFIFGWNSSMYIGAASARLEPETLLSEEVVDAF